MQKTIFEIGLRNFLWLKKLKTPCHGISHLNSEVIVENLYEKEFKKCLGLKKKHKKNEKEYRVEKVIKRRGDQLYVK